MFLLLHILFHVHHYRALTYNYGFNLSRFRILYLPPQSPSTVSQALPIKGRDIELEIKLGACVFQRLCKREGIDL
jgi:hypothetical protein